MADSIKITIEIPRAVVRDVMVGAVGIGAIYAGYRIFRGSIDAAVTKAFGGERSDQKVEDIKPGSLHVCLRCFTDERFLEVLEEYKSGKIKERLEKELSDIGIETEGLVVVGIENIKEVEKKAAALKISQEKFCIMSKSASRVGKPDQSIAKKDLTASPGGTFEITIDVDRAIVHERPAIKGKLGALFEVCKKIDQAIIRILGGIRKDQYFEDIPSGSLFVSLHCFTDERFSNVFEDIASGNLRQKLEQELSNIGVETEGLVVDIMNIEEAEVLKTNIDERQKNKKTGNPEQEDVEGLKSAEREQAMTIPQIIVKGGAYFQKTSDVNDEKYIDLIKKSTRKGYEILMRGGTAVDAVEAAVCFLEDSEYFNAGYGSILTSDGEVECDAMIMDGNTLSNGAVISGRHFKNPVSLAKLIMNDTDHCALSGEGALKFAVENQKYFLICDQTDLIAKDVKEQKIQYSEFRGYVRKRFKSESSDTVSAVARDKNGHFACAMSTGGVPGRLSGRVSDASMVGCGGYANEHGAATTSGLGESIIKMTLAREVVYMMESGQNAKEAAENALHKMRNQFQDPGLGGVIAIDKEGNFGKAFNTDMMGWVSIKDDKLEWGLDDKMEN